MGNGGKYPGSVPAGMKVYWDPIHNDWIGPIDEHLNCMNLATLAFTLHETARSPDRIVFCRQLLNTHSQMIVSSTFEPDGQQRFYVGEAFPIGTSFNTIRRRWLAVIFGHEILHTNLAGPTRCMNPVIRIHCY